MTGHRADPGPAGHPRAAFREQPKAARPKIRQPPDADARALLRASEARVQTGHLMEEAVHPYLAQTLAAQRIRDWQQEAVRAQRAKEARRARRAREMVAGGRPPLRAGRVPPAGLAQAGAALPGGAWPRLMSIGRRARRRRGVMPAAGRGAQPGCRTTVSSWKT